MNANMRDDLSALLAESDMLFCLWSEGDHSGSREIDYFIDEVENITLSYGVLLDSGNLERRLSEVLEDEHVTSIGDAIIYSIEDSLIGGNENETCI